jgi:hypothetical protein
VKGTSREKRGRNKEKESRLRRKKKFRKRKGNKVLYFGKRKEMG